MHSCTRCIAIEVDKGRKKCKICENPFQSDLPTVECVSCAKYVNFIDSYTLQCGDTFCNDCRKNKIMKDKFCFSCNKNLLPSDLFSMKKLNFFPCRRCTDLIPLKNIVEKSCCEVDACDECQGISDPCIFCGDYLVN